MEGRDILEKLNSAIILNRMNIVAIMQTLVDKGIITRDEMQETRDRVVRHPRYQELMDNVKDLENEFMDNPEEMKRLSDELSKDKTNP